MLLSNQTNGKQKMAYTCALINNTGTDTSMFDAVIAAAIANGGKFDDDYADIFVLISTPPGAVAPYRLEFV